MAKDTKSRQEPSGTATHGAQTQQPGGDGGHPGGRTAAADPHGTDGGWNQGQGQTSQPGSIMTQPDRLKRLFKDQKERILDVLPKKMSLDRWIGVVLALNYRDAKMQECSLQSIFLSALQGAMLGLDFNPALKQAYLIPRRNKNVIDPRTGKPGAMVCTFMPGYAGLRKLALNSGEFRWIESRIVYQSEVDGTHGLWSVEYSSEGDDDISYTHKPNLNPATRGDVALVYVVAMTKNGHRVMEMMTKDEIEREAHHKAETYKQAKDRGEEESPTAPWVIHWGMQARKTVLKRFCGQTEMNVEALNKAIAADNEQYQTEAVRMFPEATRGSQSLADRLGVSRGPIPPEPIDPGSGENWTDDLTVDDIITQGYDVESKDEPVQAPPVEDRGAATTAPTETSPA